MKNLLVLLIVFALIGTVSAQCLTGPIWGLANSENPYTFSTDADPFTTQPATADCWVGWNGANNNCGSTSGGELTLDPASGYELAFVHDNLPADIGVTPGVDKIELVIEVVSITGSAIVKIEQFPASDSFPNPDNGTGSIVQDLWDPDTTITGPGRYSFVTAAVCDAATVAVTPVIGVADAGTIVIDEIWIGAEGNDPGSIKPTNPAPGHNSIPASGSVTTTSWTNPAPFDGTSDLTVNWRIEKENATDGGGNPVYDPNWGAANGVPTTMVTKSGIDMTFKNFGFLTSPYTAPLADGLYSWRVDVDAVEGNVWLFKVGDAPPEPNQPDNQFMYVSQADSDGNSNIRTFSVTFDYTDDGKSQITAADVVNLNWGWDPDGADNILGTEDDERGIEMTGVVYNPVLPATTTSGTVTATFQTHYDAADPNYSTDIPGYWDIRLEVTDATGTALGTAGHFEIFETCGEAAFWDPDDPFDTTYDANLDCRTNLPDFADFALQWMSQGPLYE
ncbi:MAG: hypothetical protein H8E62_07970 [Planctomycetes bacterium]|nr:hypothetical protein [Planctomycetota bacterium]